MRERREGRGEDERKKEWTKISRPQTSTQINIHVHG